MNKKLTDDSLDFLYVSKIIAVFGMVFSLLSLGLAIASILSPEVPTDIDDDVSQSFEFWVYSVMVALPSLLLYLPDGVFCIIRAFRKLDIIYNVILGIMILFSIPMIIFVGSWYPGSIIWNIYYFIILVLEIISMFQKSKHKLSAIKEST